MNSQDIVSKPILQFRRSQLSIDKALERFETHKTEFVQNVHGHRQYRGAVNGGCSKWISKCVNCGYETFEFYQTDCVWRPSDKTPICPETRTESEALEIEESMKRKRENHDEDSNPDPHNYFVPEPKHG
jgi:hypothetical protein